MRPAVQPEDCCFDAEWLGKLFDLLLDIVGLAVGYDASAIGELGTDCQHMTSCFAFK